MIEIKKSEQRGTSKWEWLDSYHSFSFADFYDPDMVQFGPLRVLNEDFIAGGGGFPMHPHRDMEIITYVIDGELEHEDNMGSRETIKKNEVQKMSAGKGVFHSEFNASPSESVHLFQTWIVPNKRNLEPYYETRTFTAEDKENTLLAVGSPDGRGDTVFISQDALMYIGAFDAGKSVPYTLKDGRGLYLHVVEGRAEIGGHTAETGDAFMVTDETEVTVNFGEKTEIILFDVDMDA